MHSFIEHLESRTFLSASPSVPAPVTASLDHGVLHIELNNGSAIATATGSQVLVTDGSNAPIGAFMNVTNIVVDAAKGTTNTFDGEFQDSTLRVNVFEADPSSVNTVILNTASGNAFWVIEADKNSSNVITDENQGAGTSVVVLEAEKGSTNALVDLNVGTGKDVVAVEADKGSNNTVVSLNLGSGSSDVHLEASKGSTNSVEVDNTGTGTSSLEVDAAKGAHDTVTTSGPVTVST